MSAGSAGAVLVPPSPLSGAASSSPHAAASRENVATTARPRRNRFRVIVYPSRIVAETRS